MGRDWRSFVPPQCSPTEYLERLGVLGSNLALVHMTFATPDDLDRVAAAGSPIVLCPRSNLHITGKLPDVPAMIERGITLAVGTDSVASCPDLDVLRDVAVLAKAFPAVDGRVWLRAVTAGGAKVLGREDLGALRVGARPGLLQIRVATDDPVAALCSAPKDRSWIERRGRPTRAQRLAGPPPPRPPLG
jgi:cytosine/adenosine deaminase-related metal-dependent hydrolase